MAQLVDSELYVATQFRYANSVYRVEPAKGVRSLQVAIIHPQFLALGGAEKVVETLGQIYPQADIFTLSALPEKIPRSLRNRKINTTFLNDLSWSRKKHNRLSVLYPMAVESMDLREYDLVISSAGPAVFGVNVPQNAMHICYCHSPERTWWDQYTQRARSLHFARRMFYIARASYLRTWEFGAAQRVDHFIANSAYISRRVHKYFRRESTVIYPPVDTGQGYISKKPGDYFLSVGRLTAPKRVDLLIGACNLLKKRLLIVGTGKEEKKLKAMAGPTIEFLGYVPDEDLRQLYAECRAFLFAADEDFGIVPVEAQSYGRPVIAYGYGGSLETVRVGDSRGRSDTGVFFAERTVDAVIDGIRRFEATEGSFVPTKIQEHARSFDTTVFVDQMRHFINQVLVKG